MDRYQHAAGPTLHGPGGRLRSSDFPDPWFYKWDPQHGGGPGDFLRSNSISNPECLSVPLCVPNGVGSLLFPEIGIGDFFFDFFDGFFELFLADVSRMVARLTGTQFFKNW